MVRALSSPLSFSRSLLSGCLFLSANCPQWSIGNHYQYNHSDSAFTGGAHGYDHTLPSMRATIAARGKFFQVRCLDYGGIYHV